MNILSRTDFNTLLFNYTNCLHLIKTREQYKELFCNSFRIRTMAPDPRRAEQSTRGWEEPQYLEIPTPQQTSHEVLMKYLLRYIVMNSIGSLWSRVCSGSVPWFKMGAQLNNDFLNLWCHELRECNPVLQSRASLSNGLQGLSFRTEWID